MNWLPFLEEIKENRKQLRHVNPEIGDVLGAKEKLTDSMRAMAQHFDDHDDPRHRLLRQAADRLDGAPDASRLKLRGATARVMGRMYDGTHLGAMMHPDKSVHLVWQPEPGELFDAMLHHHEVKPFLRDLIRQEGNKPLAQRIWSMFKGGAGPKKLAREGNRLDIPSVGATGRAMIHAHLHGDTDAIPKLADHLDEIGHPAAQIFKELRDRGGYFSGGTIIDNSDGYRYETNPMNSMAEDNDYRNKPRTHLALNISPIAKTKTHQVSVSFHDSDAPSGSAHRHGYAYVQVPDSVTDEFFSHFPGTDEHKHYLHLKNVRDLQAREQVDQQLAREGIEFEHSVPRGVAAGLAHHAESHLAELKDAIEEHEPDHPLKPLLDHLWAHPESDISKDHGRHISVTVPMTYNKDGLSFNIPATQTFSRPDEKDGQKVHHHGVLLAPVMNDHRAKLTLFFGDYTGDKPQIHRSHYLIPHEVAEQFANSIGGDFKKHWDATIRRRQEWMGANVNRGIPARPFARQETLASTVPQLKSSIQKTRELIAHKVMSEAGFQLEAAPLIHVTPETTRSTLLNIVQHPNDPAGVRYAAAWYGLLAKERALTAFHPRPDGQDSLHVLDTHKKLPDIVRILKAAGVQRFSMQPKTLGARVFIFNPSSTRNLDAVGGLLNASHSVIRGVGDTFGSSAGTDADARAEFRRVISDYESEGESDGGDSGAGAAPGSPANVQ
jgi:hypothetical protein